MAGTSHTTASGWGPQRRRAAVTVTFETLAPDALLSAAAADDDAPGPPADAGAHAAPSPPADAGAHAAPGLPTGDDEMRVTPALPTVLRILADRDLAATFFTDADVARTDALALTMIAAGGHEIAALAGDDLASALSELRAAGAEIRGLRARTVAATPPPDALASAALRYVQAPGERLEVADGIVRIPLDRQLADAAYLAPALVGGDPGRPRHPGAWHEALQVAIGRAVARGEHLTVTFFPGLLERADALAVFVEALDLVTGLRRAERLWTPALHELAAWRLAADRSP